MAKIELDSHSIWQHLLYVVWKTLKSVDKKHTPGVSKSTTSYAIYNKDFFKCIFFVKHKSKSVHISLICIDAECHSLKKQSCLYGYLRSPDSRKPDIVQLWMEVVKSY